MGFKDCPYFRIKGKDCKSKLHNSYKQLELKRVIVITETFKVCTLLIGKYHSLQIKIVDFNFEMYREIIIVFALQRCVNSGQKLSERLGKLIFSLFLEFSRCFFTDCSSFL